MRALGAHDARGGQDAARGQRRRGRGGRLPRVLRARDAAPGHAQAHGPRARRAQRLLLPAAGRRPRDRPVELPARHPHGHDERGPGRRQPGDRQARRADAGDRRAAGPPAWRRPERRPARSTSCPARAARSATSSSVTRASTSSPSPAPWRSACASSARRRSTPRSDGVKKVIAEMGGKNAIIVDTDADLDVAVSEVVVSAFHYGGQKCSAASRVIVLEAAYDEFVRRLVEATRSLVVGPPDGPGDARRPGHHRRRAGQDRGLHRAGEARGDAGRRRRAARGRLARRRLLRRPARLRRRPRPTPSSPRRRSSVPSSPS